MAYVTSRNFHLPETKAKMSASFWFNLWTKRFWPYRAISPGDVLYWYESRSQCVLWRSHIRTVVAFEYANKRDAANRLIADFGEFPQDQSYFQSGPEAGYCLAWNVEPIARVNLPRPVGFRFNQLGWMKLADVVDQWPELAV